MNMSPLTLIVLDYVFYWLHLTVTGFNLFGWIPKATRALHRWCVGITLFCWLGAGLWVGHIGYCPLTDWHWDIKQLRGQTALPNSLITYLLNQMGLYPGADIVYAATAFVFAGIVMVTVGLWIKERKNIHQG